MDEDEERRKHGVPISDWPSVGGPVEFTKDLSKTPGGQISGNDVMTVRFNLCCPQFRMACAIYCSRTFRFIGPLGQIVDPIGSAELSALGVEVDTKIP